jgi:hypothetical protein
MTIPWQTMTVEEFAGFRHSLGERVLQANGVFWRQVRPCFYRPILPYQEYPPGSVSGPVMAGLGGFQHAAPSGARTNSFLNLLIFEDLKSYSVGDLKGNDRREIKNAAETFTISLVTNVMEFKTQAYPVYRSFYERTKYEYKSERRYEDNFSKWADLLFQHSKVIVLGAYGKNRQLVAIGVWLLVQDTLIYSMFFCETESLKKHVPGLMLHAMRETASGCPGIKQIYIGNIKSSPASGVDKFYLARGCKLVRKPAWLQLNPLTAFVLKRFSPGQYGRLIGDIKGLPGSPDIVPGEPSAKRGTGSISGETKAVESGRVVPP